VSQTRKTGWDVRENDRTERKKKEASARKIERASERACKDNGRRWEKKIKG
jgi:hypothetical protein